MELSPQAVAALPEIARWMAWKADALTNRSAKNSLRTSIWYLDAESARLTAADTYHLFDRLGDGRGMWPWTDVFEPEFEHAQGSLSGAVIGWSRWIRERPGAKAHRVSHESIVQAMRNIVDQRDTWTAGDNPALDLDGISLVHEVISASDRSEVDYALAALTPKVCVAIVRLAAFGKPGERS